MCFGKAVVVTDVMDAPFYIESGKTGVLVPSGNAQALRQAIVDLLDSPQTAQAMGAAAREAALPIDQEYTWSNVLALAFKAHQQRLAGLG